VRVKLGGKSLQITEKICQYLKKTVFLDGANNADTEIFRNGTSQNIFVIRGAKMLRLKLRNKYN